MIVFKLVKKELMHFFKNKMDIVTMVIFPIVLILVMGTSLKGIMNVDTNIFNEINEMCNMMTTEYVCEIDTNKTDYFVKLTVHDLWLGDIRIIKDSIGITLDSAYRALLTVNQKTPESNLVSMRQPITAPPFMTHPIYIFGNMMDNIIIDGMTGRVVE